MVKTFAEEIKKEMENERLEFFGFTKIPGVKRMVKDNLTNILSNLEHKKQGEVENFFEMVEFLDIKKALTYSVSEYQELSGEKKVPDFVIFKSKPYTLTSSKGDTIQINSSYYLYCLNKYMECKDKFEYGLNYSDERVRAVKSNFLCYQDLLKDKLNS